MKRQTVYCLCFALLVLGTVPAQNKSGIKGIPVFSANSKQKSTPEISAKISSISRPGKSKNSFWDSQSNNWQYTDTSIYTYNISGQLLNETHRNNTPYSRQLNTYDAQGRLTQELYQNWNNSNTWENSSRTVYTFDNNGYQTEMRYDTYNTSTNQWETQFGQRNLVTYTLGTRVIDNIYQNWNSNTNQWENNNRETAMVYDGNGNITQYDGQLFNGTSWDNDNRLKITYSLNNQPVEAVFQQWSGTAYLNSERLTNLTWHNWCGLYCDNSSISSATMQSWGTLLPNQWATDSRMNITYDNYGGSVELDQDYLLGLWVNSYRYTMSYDTHYNSTGSKSESWNTTSNLWEIDYEEKIIHTYDNNSNITQSIWQYWNSTINVLENNEKREYFNFQVYAGLRELDEITNQAVIYPNPCAGNCSIKIKESLLKNSNELSELHLYNSLGAEVLSTEFTGNETSFDRRDLKPGIYYYSIFSDRVQISKGKILLQ